MFECRTVFIEYTTDRRNCQAKSQKFLKTFCAKDSVGFKSPAGLQAAGGAVLGAAPPALVFVAGLRLLGAKRLTASEG
jgi:hypothetical protein